MPPRFAPPGSFQHAFALKWKELYAQHAEQMRLLDAQFNDAVRKLELDEMDARLEHQTAVMREGAVTDIHHMCVFHDLPEIHHGAVL